MDVRTVTRSPNRARSLERNGAAGSGLGSRRAMDRLGSIGQGSDGHARIQTVLPEDHHHRAARISRRRLTPKGRRLFPGSGSLGWREWAEGDAASPHLPTGRSELYARAFTTI